MIMCILCQSELILSESMFCPNATVALTAHSTASLMPCDFSTGTVCRSVSVLLAFKGIFNLVHLYRKSALDQV